MSTLATRLIIRRLEEAPGIKPYIGIVHRGSDSAYGVALPDAPGCFSEADRLDDLFDMAEEALGLWFEIMSGHRSEFPGPRSLSALREDPEWAACFADVVLLIAIRSPRLGVRDAA